MLREDGGHSGVHIRLLLLNERGTLAQINRRVHIELLRLLFVHAGDGHASDQRPRLAQCALRFVLA